MKIGILTFWNTPDNYGQMLQCYALQSYLRTHGHETFLVRTGAEWKPVSGFVPQLKDKIRSASRLTKYPLYFTGKAFSNIFYMLTHGQWKQYTIERDFDSFRKEYLHCSDMIFSLEELKKNPPEADCFIVGSDQIWNTRDGIYFLSWANESVKKIAYAASFGGLKGEQEFYDLIRPWIKRFDWISVREQSGLEICKQSGRDDTELVCDPTLLLKKKDYSKLGSAPKQKPSKKFIFVYLLGTRTRISMPEVFAYAKSKGLDVVYVGSQGVVDRFKREESTVQEWLWYVEHAEMVFTNSFHGIVFSLIFQKQFIAFPVYGAAVRMNDRINTILKFVQLEDHIIQNSLAEADKKIDYSVVSKVLNEQAIQSGTKLSGQLNV